MSEEYIMHYGIPKMKWGLRRYQNLDGSYTEEGKRRRRKYSDDYEHYRSLKKKSYKEMSNKELNEYNNRANLEANYKNLKSRTSAIKKGMAVVSAVSGALVVANNLYNNANLFEKNYPNISNKIKVIIDDSKNLSDVLAVADTGKKIVNKMINNLANDVDLVKINY